MGEPIRSKGAIPKPWKRRQHVERQARLAHGNRPFLNPVKILKHTPIAPAPVGEVRIIQGPVIPHGIRRTESLRNEHRWNEQDGKLLSLRKPRKCSVCSTWMQPGRAAWWNPFTKAWTCTRCTPIE